MAGVDETFEPVGAAVARLRRVQVDAVVSPVARTGELRDRHELDGGDAERDQVRQAIDRRVERPAGREGADVQLVGDEVGDGAPAPAAVGPGERPRVDDAAPTVGAARLMARGRVGALAAPGDDEDIVGARRRVAAVDLGFEHAGVLGRAVVAASERNRALARAEQTQIQVIAARRPHAEAHAAIG